MAARIATALVRSAGLSLALGTSTLVAQEQYPFKYEINPHTSAFQPIDVAVFSPIDSSSNFLLVVDQGGNQVMEYPLQSDGSLAGSGFALVSFGATELVRAVAVNDIPGHANFGQVYVTTHDTITNTSMIYAYLLDGTSSACNMGPLGNPLVDVVALAVDKDGDVYAADQSAKISFRFDQSWFTPHWCAFMTPTASYLPQYPTLFGPADIAVTESGLVLHVDTLGYLMASNRDGTDFWYRFGGLPLLPGTDIDAHDEDEVVWCAGTSSDFAEGWFFPDCYANMGTGASVEAVTTVANGGALNIRPRCEYHRFWDMASFSGGPYPRCTERLFVADTKNYRVACFARARTTVVPRPGKMTAWWRFDETGNHCYDSTGHGNTGTFSFSVPTERTEGLVRHGLTFGPGDDGLEMKDDPSLNLGNGSYTVECWVRTCDTGSIRYIVDKMQSSGVGSPIEGYALVLDSGCIAFEIAHAGQLQFFSTWYLGTPGFVADGKFHHLAVTVHRPTETLTFYVDGKTNTSFANTIATNVRGNIDNTAALLIGADPITTNLNGFFGELDEVCLYKKAFPAATITSIYNAYDAGKR